MTDFTRRSALLGGAAAASLAACAPNPLTAPDGSAGVAPGAKAPAPLAAFRDGLGLAAAIASGETTAMAEVEAAIARAAAVNPAINAIASSTYDAARAQAASASGPFAGVPSFIKDLVDWKGAETSYGSRAFKGNVAAEDVPFAAKWRGAGIVSLGKSTTPEMGLTSSTEPLVSGATRNPWDTARSPGGSSGGAAALVAARVVPFASASDGGGSIRIPASTCGLFGLKPSRGRIPSREMGPTPPVELSVNHAVTISVRDSIALFQASEDSGGAYPALGAIPPLDRRLRIGFAPDAPAGTAVAAETRTALEETAQLCRDLGHTVVDFRVPMDGVKFLDQFLLYWAAGAAQFTQDASRYSGKPISPEIVEPWTLGLAGMFLARQAEMPDVVAYLKGFEAEYHSAFETVDIVLQPVTGSPAVPIGEQAPDGDYETVMESVLRFAAFTAPANAAGAASMSVPLGWSPAGLPIGSMFSGKRGDDALLFALALELEAARPWADRRPPVSAF